MVTKEQEDLLNHLMEECAEVIQACSKIRRYGFDSYGPNAKHTNLEHLWVELDDVVTVKRLLERSIVNG